jgi:hypothetical protein
MERKGQRDKKCESFWKCIDARQWRKHHHTHFVPEHYTLNNPTDKVPNRSHNAVARTLAAAGFRTRGDGRRRVVGVMTKKSVRSCAVSGPRKEPSSWNSENSADPSGLVWHPSSISPSRDFQKQRPCVHRVAPRLAAKGHASRA